MITYSLNSRQRINKSMYATEGVFSYILAVGREYIVTLLIL